MASVPMFVPAPVRFSMTNGWPRFRPRDKPPEPHALDPAAFAGVKTDPAWPSAMLAVVATEDFGNTKATSVALYDTTTFAELAREPLQGRGKDALQPLG